MFKTCERAADEHSRAWPRIATFDANLAYRGQTHERRRHDGVGQLFPVAGIRPALGRLLTPEDDTTIGGHFVVVLSEGVLADAF